MYFEFQKKKEETNEAPAANDDLFAGVPVHDPDVDDIWEYPNPYQSDKDHDGGKW